MDDISTLGIIGALILVSGSAYPIKKVSHPIRSTKNWLFAIGGLLMLIYASLNHLYGNGALFFIFLQGLVNIASIFMLSNTPERIASPIIIGLGLLLIIWSLTLFEDVSTLFFIIGLSGIALGYVLTSQDFKRNLSLFFGSLLIALFSYLSGDWIFFWLNVFFAGFAGYYALRVRRQ